jgi:hypothetical protein
LYGRVKEREMDLTGRPGDAGRMDRVVAQTCPSCGWPAAEPFEVVSRHATSEGTITWSRCVCGRLQVHRDSAIVLRSPARTTWPWP